VWELKGKYPAILENKKYGSEAKKLYEDANNLLTKIIDEDLLTANGVLGLFAANSVGDDIEVYSNYERKGLASVLHSIRQQSKKSSSSFNLALADFIAPKDCGMGDYIGAFAVTAGIGIEYVIKQFQNSNDDYNVIMIKALADRLAEAFTELLHEKVRREFWDYAPEENLNNEELIKEKYKGIRPAPGYPSQPDHTEKLALFKLLDVEKNVGITLTENLAMHPAASVCGLYFANPMSKYFNIGKIGKDQVLDYRKRKGLSLQEVEKWLKPYLNYEIGE